MGQEGESRKGRGEEERRREEKREEKRKGRRERGGGSREGETRLKLWHRSVLSDTGLEIRVHFYFN